ncbi:MAG: Jag N-terminal domain-containing protein [Chitinophagaceae bacterium]|nr:Jag N-terminal domain-containing protein [Anaerolineae bacterium]
MEPLPSVEITGETVEAAINAGLVKLGVGPGDVIVEVIDEPSRGVFGIGARPARVRLKMLRPPTPAPVVVPAIVPSPPPPATVLKPVSAPSHAPVTHNEDYTDSYDDEVDEVYLGDVAEAIDAPGEDGEIGKQVLVELLERMMLKAEISVRRAEPSRPGESAPWLLDVNGSDMNSLIGRKGETLAALQYITRLIASRRLQRRANIIVDVSGYKMRRSQRLRELAMRMADQAIQQARTVTLEPMPPNERRIVHLTLRNRTDVFTKSTGEGDARKVTIVPK